MVNDRIFNMTFASVYPLYVKKVEKKGRTKEELNQVIEWLTGYKKESLQEVVDNELTFTEFFEKAPVFNENASLIKGVICGYAIEWKK